MALHLLKLCVGIDSPEQLEEHVLQRLARLRSQGEPVEVTHTTRMIPRRKAELLDGGSLYWVIRGSIQVRQRLLDIRPFRDEAGIRRCHLVLESAWVQTMSQPRRPFQGWRYLGPDDAPADLAGGATDQNMPATLRRELAEMGLL